MRNSRVKRRGATRFAGLLALLLAATPAFAASGGEGIKPAATGAPTSIDPTGSGGEAPALGPPVPPEAPAPEQPPSSEVAPSEPASGAPAATELPAAEPAFRDEAYTPPATSMETVGPRPGVNEPTVEVAPWARPTPPVSAF
jgi:hypothetical protein